MSFFLYPEFLYSNLWYLYFYSYIFILISKSFTHLKKILKITVFYIIKNKNGSERGTHQVKISRCSWSFLNILYSICLCLCLSVLRWNYALLDHQGQSDSVSTSWVATVTSMHHHAQMPWKVYHTDQNPCEIVTQYTPVKMFALLHYDIIGYRKKWAIAITCHLNVSCFSSGAWCMCVRMFMCMGTCVHSPEVDAGCLSLISLHCIFWTWRSSPLMLQWSGSELPGSFPLCLPSTRATQTWLSTQAWELERQESALQVSYSLSHLQQFVLIGCLERLWVTWEINDRYSLILQRRDSWE